jgi:hypothetical protein
MKDGAAGSCTKTATDPCQNVGDHYRLNGFLRVFRGTVGTMHSPFGSAAPSPLCRVGQIENRYRFSLPLAFAASGPFPLDVGNICANAAFGRQAMGTTSATGLGHSAHVSNDGGRAKCDCVLSRGERSLSVIPLGTIRVSEPVREGPGAFEQDFEEMPAFLVRFPCHGQAADMIGPRSEVANFWRRIGRGPRDNRLRDIGESEQGLTASHADGLIIEHLFGMTQGIGSFGQISIAAGKSLDGKFGQLALFAARYAQAKADMKSKRNIHIGELLSIGPFRTERHLQERRGQPGTIKIIFPSGF